MSRAFAAREPWHAFCDQSCDIFLKKGQHNASLARNGVSGVGCVLVVRLDLHALLLGVLAQTMSRLNTSILLVN